MATNGSGGGGGSPEDMPDELNQLSYYFSTFTSLEEVVDVFRKHITIDGTFILRNSKSKSGNFTLSVVHNKGVKHISISLKNGFYHMAKHRFPNVQDLVKFYQHNDVPNKEDVIGIRLIHPLNVHFQVWGNQKNQRTASAPLFGATSHSGQHPILKDSSSWPAGASDVKIKASSLGPPPPLRQRSYEENNNNSAPLPSGMSERPQPRPQKDGVLPPQERSVGGHDYQNDSPSTSPQRPPRIDNRNPEDKQYGKLVQSAFKEELAKLLVLPAPRAPTKPGEGTPVSPPDVRPPLPLPHQPPAPDVHFMSYARPRALDDNLAQELIYSLMCVEHCECGLLEKDARMPDHWKMHLTGYSAGPQVFFVSPDMNSHWELPRRIKELLKQHHKEVLARYGIHP